MYKVCKTEQSASRQRQLEQGLQELMNQRRYEDITVSDLCSFMGIPRKSFYRYFSSKDGALYALLDHTMMEYELFSHVAQSGKRRDICAELEEFFLFWKNHSRMLDALKKSGMTGILMERSLEYASRVQLPQRLLVGLEKWEQEQVVTFSICGLMVMMVNWHQSGFARGSRDMARVAARLISSPLYPNVML